jgi:hypothetical protein
VTIDNLLLVEASSCTDNLLHVEATSYTDNFLNVEATSYRDYQLNVAITSVTLSEETEMGQSRSKTKAKTVQLGFMSSAL